MLFAGVARLVVQQNAVSGHHIWRVLCKRSVDRCVSPCEMWSRAASPSLIASGTVGDALNLGVCFRAAQLVYCIAHHQTLQQSMNRMLPSRKRPASGHLPHQTSSDSAVCPVYPAYNHHQLSLHGVPGQSSKLWLSVWSGCTQLGSSKESRRSWPSDYMGILIGHQHTVPGKKICYYTKRSW
jgi:hypothetical protein